MLLMSVISLVGVKPKVISSCQKFTWVKVGFNQSCVILFLDTCTIISNFVAQGWRCPPYCCNRLAANGSHRWSYSSAGRYHKCSNCWSGKKNSNIFFLTIFFLFLIALCDLLLTDSWVFRVSGFCSCDLFSQVSYQLMFVSVSLRKKWEYPYI